MADMTQLTGAYAASWLPWIMIPLIFYILPFPVFAIIFLWIERENGGQGAMGQDLDQQSSGLLSQAQTDAMGVEPMPPS
jgi:photosystem I subunit 8